MSEIRAVLIVRDHTAPRDKVVVVGEVPGPWDSVEEAVNEALCEGQTYRVAGDVILAQVMPEQTS